MKKMIINDGRYYHVIETINYYTAKELQDKLRNGISIGFTPIYTFDFNMNFIEKFKKIHEKA